MRRVPPAALCRLAAVDPVQSCYSLYSRISLSSQATTSAGAGPACEQQIASHSSTLQIYHKLQVVLAEPETIEALPREETGRHTSSRSRKVLQVTYTPPAIIVLVVPI